MTEQKIVLHVLSDAVGETARSVANAVASQFPDNEIKIRTTGMIRSVEELRSIVVPHEDDPGYIFLYTFAKEDLHNEMDEVIKEGAVAIDVLGPVVSRIERVTKKRASSFVGALRQTDAKYFDRIDAMEFSVAHDDGRRPEGLINADIVLIGVSRTSKTPLSMYLAYRGVRTANIPLAPGVDPPKELFEIDPRKIYGLMSTPEVLLSIRRARMKELGAFVPHYAEIEYVEAELEEARALMRKLGCIVINTANRAVEEVAQEILHFVAAGE